MASKNVSSIGEISSSCSSSLKPLSFPEVERDMRCYYNANHDVPIPCMLCEETFNCNSNNSNEISSEICTATKPDYGDSSRQLFIQHLFKEHKIVIHRISDIASYRFYSKYWKIRFKEVDINQLLPIIKTNPETSDPSESFYLLSDANQEDKELRKFLQQKKLIALLGVQQKERDSISFSERCLFCSELCTGNRSSLFNHMNKSHNFCIGQPDNIVLVDEFLDTLRSKLTNLQCLYCERTFRDLPTLKDHMRKKQHRKINPNNGLYDKYYLINYLEIGKSWQEIQKENDKDIAVDDDSDEQNVEIEEDGSNDESLVCLFCTVTLNSTDTIIDHMMTVHGFDYNTIILSLKDDFYAQVKVINYIRRQIHHQICIYCEVKHKQLSELIDHMTVTRHFKLPQRSLWDQPQYLFPTFENDGLLCVLNADNTLQQ